jgi:hypothetical protein
MSHPPSTFALTASSGSERPWSTLHLGVVVRGPVNERGWGSDGGGEMRDDHVDRYDGWKVTGRVWVVEGACTALRQVRGGRHGEG